MIYSCDRMSDSHKERWQKRMSKDMTWSEYGDVRQKPVAKSESASRWVMSYSLHLHALQPARVLCPWNSPGKNTGVGCRSLLQGIFPTQGLKSVLLHCRQWQNHVYRIMLMLSNDSKYLFFKIFIKKKLWERKKKNTSQDVNSGSFWIVDILVFLLSFNSYLFTLFPQMYLYILLFWEKVIENSR